MRIGYVTVRDFDEVQRSQNVARKLAGILNSNFSGFTAIPTHSA